ncbi:DUF4391 domain-containing protein [Janthinobacterium sp. PLB04]|uniref:DUF4391 domain-containing protein n=1 Tax=Janthinobacterium lividum TaxID=29581 RepID=A0AAJ4MXG7_9BURK|nr:MULTISPECIES: DUF4391 domain-containing protein [Janthinobacterium]KAB0332323.1 DUF4391 domain-containing protein [Janthinobacterium lividum]QSX99074.1 DUF4391 domain-containing protein [Janthinobacterium lividum]UGQ39015.1 DUF4391 domain-containing protein [Janthinobacterium sp. PLB04]
MAFEVIAALALPASCRVDQRVPKRMLIENGAPTAADKRLLTDTIEEIQWIAALKPNTVGIPNYRDGQREYLEVAVLSITTRGANSISADDEAAAPARMPATKMVNTARLAELVHRAVPYPVLLLLTTPQGLFLSAAHKRWAQNEAAKIVLDGEVTIVEVAVDLTPAHPFMQSVALTRQPQTTLMALYQGWLDCLTALQVSRYTGTYKVMDDPAHADARRAALRECLRLEQEATRLSVQAAKEKQMAKQVDLNLAIKGIQADLSAAREQL